MIYFGIQCRRRKRERRWWWKIEELFSREQAVDRHRALPVPQRKDSAQPRSLRSIGLEQIEGSRLPEWADGLPDQARVTARLPRSATQKPGCRDGSCVSPALLIPSRGSREKATPYPEHGPLERVAIPPDLL